ncbi:MAG: hypothetical protein IKM39_04640 [Clostridia bacterium]|nr:hypothetical protein [Clostridia bacterium]
MKRFFALILTFVLVVSLFAGIPVQAASIVAKGIDVSAWQGNINWNAVKADSHGNYAILRAYCAGKDTYFDTNYANAKAAGVPVGAYCFIYGTTTAAVQAEVNALLQVIEGKQFEYPIYIDIEDDNYHPLGMDYNANLVKMACEMLQDAGYFAGVYTYLYFTQSFVNMNLLTNYTTWIAEYNSSCNYTGAYAMWQYGCEGSVGGISPVDVNYCYEDFPTIMKSVGLNGYEVVDTQVNAVVDAINALPTTVTVNHQTAIEAARAAYNALTDTQKAKVTNLATLVSAEQKLAAAQAEAADKAAAKVVDDMIAALPAVNSLTLNDEAAVNAARDAYQDLALAQRNYVNNLGLLEAAEAKLSALQQQENNDKAAAQGVDSMIAALPGVNALTLNDKTAVNAARDAYQDLTLTQRNYVNNLNILEAAEAQIALLEKLLTDETAPAFVIEDVTARVGGTVTVAVGVKNNPGIVSAKVKVAYDANVLEVLSMEAGAFEGITFSPVTNNPLVFNWMDSIHPNNTTNGALVYITFKVRDTATAGTTPLTITYDGDDVFDYEYNNIAFGVINGTVNLIEYIPGDLNDDGVINNKDYSLLERYLNDWNVTISEEAADVNRDGKINNKDYSLLQRYLNDWDVELK